MAKSVFRRFPSGDLNDDLPEWEHVNINGQSFVKSAVGSATWEIMEDFWEAEIPPPPESAPPLRTMMGMGR